MDQWDTRITTEEIDAFMKKHGRMSTQTLAVLNKQHDFYEAFTTPIGQELTKDLMIRMDRLGAKMVEGTVSEEERLEYKVCREMFSEWMKRIKVYLVHAKKIRE